MGDDRSPPSVAPGAESRPPPSRLSLLAAFAAIYLIWGSTYLAIRFAIESLPPFSMASIRFLVAGGVMYLWARLRGIGAPEPRQWGAAALVGALLLVFGVGGVSWAEQRLPSGAAALIVTVGPLWMVLIDWLFFGGRRPSRRVVLGILLGFSGVALLIGPEQVAGAGRIDMLGAGVILVGTVTWSFGSLYSRGSQLPASPILATGMEMLAGGVLLLLVALAFGEPGRIDVGQVSARSLLATAYLAVFGSIVALSAYLWLLKVDTPSRVITHAYVNPVVAVFLGWALAAEPLNARTLAATAIIISGVLVITRRERPQIASVEMEHA